MATFAALFGTNLLSGFHLNDVILGMAERGPFRPLGSEQILVALSDNLIEHGLHLLHIDEAAASLLRFPASVDKTDMASPQPLAPLPAPEWAPFARTACRSSQLDASDHRCARRLAAALSKRAPGYVSLGFPDPRKSI